MNGRGTNESYLSLQNFNEPGSSEINEGPGLGARAERTDAGDEFLECDR